MFQTDPPLSSKEVTEKEDLGQTLREINQPPTKWEVYERILRVPYYILFDRYTDKLQAFQLVADRYSELDLSIPRVWMPGLELGLGLWQGSYQQIERLWLRWYDRSDNWLPTPLERESQRANRLAAQLRELGVNPDKL